MSKYILLQEASDELGVPKTNLYYYCKNRVFYVNKLFRMGLLYVFDTKETDELSEALKVRAYDQNGKPEKGQGEKAPDHFCDALEYVIYRIVRSDPDFMNLKELSRENITENGYLNIAGKNV